MYCAVLESFLEGASFWHKKSGEVRAIKKFGLDKSHLVHGKDVAVKFGYVFGVTHSEKDVVSLIKGIGGGVHQNLQDSCNA